MLQIGRPMGGRSRRMRFSGTLLETCGLAAFYGDYQALFGVYFHHWLEWGWQIHAFESITGLVRAKAEVI
jgi:hypothetical protein